MKTPFVVRLLVPSPFHYFAGNEKWVLADSLRYRLTLSRGERSFEGVRVFPCVRSSAFVAMKRNGTQDYKILGAFLRSSDYCEKGWKIGVIATRRCQRISFNESGGPFYHTKAARHVFRKTRTGRT